MTAGEPRNADGVEAKRGYTSRELNEIVRVLRGEHAALMEAWMTSLVIDVEDIRPVSVGFTKTSLIVELADGRSITTPLAWYPRLARATQQQRRNVELGRVGLHWPDLDEDLSIAGMLAGRGSVAA